MKETTDIGIVITIPEKIQKEACKIQEELFEAFKRKEMQLEKCRNIFHITLFQLNIENSKLEELKKIIENIANKQSSFDIMLDAYLTDIQKHIFWSSTQAKYSDDFKLLYRKVINSTYELKADSPIKQYRDNQYSEEENKLIEKYGMPINPLDNINPHITICYNSGKDRNNENGEFIKLSNIISFLNVDPAKFKTQEIAIARLGEYGNVEEILCSYKLQLEPKICITK